MSVNIRDYVSDDHVESIGEIARSQSAIIQALSIDNSNLEKQLQQKENIIKKAINYIKEESWFCYKDNEEVIDRVPVEKLLEILGDNDENI